MLDHLDWDNIDQDSKNKIEEIERESSNFYKILLLGNSGVGKKTFLNNLINEEFAQLPTQEEKVFVSIYQKENNLISIYDLRSSEYNDDNGFYFENADGALGIFDISDKSTFKITQDLVSKSIEQGGKILPLILVGNKIDLDYESGFSKEDVLIYAYNLADASCHRVPYVELSTLENTEYEEILDDVIKIIECDLVGRCAEKPGQLRKWCEINQFYSYYDNSLNIIKK